MPQDDNNPFEENEKQENPDGKKRSAEESAAEMWGQINKSVSEEKRDELKEDLPKEDVAEDSAPKRRRRRRRRRGNGENSLPPVSPFSEEDEKEQKEAKEVKDNTIKVENPFDVTNPFENTAEAQDVEVFQPDSKTVEEAEQADEVIDEKDNVEKVEVKSADDSEAKEEEVLEQEPEVVEVETVPVEAVDAIAKNEVDDFKEDFWDILEHAGLSKGHFFGIVGFLLFVIVGFIVFLFGFVGGADEPKKVVEKPAEITEVEESDADVPATEVDGVISSYIFGLEFVDPLKPINAQPLDSLADLKGVDASVELGQALEDKTQFGAYMSLLRELQDIYSNDVYAYLDLSTDRRKALTDYLAKMNKLIVDGDMALNQINIAMDSLDAEYGEVTLLRDENEEKFFSLAEGLYGDTAYGSLDEFVKYSQRATKIKADYNAYNLLKEMFVNSLNALDLRYKDINLNQEAVIKGIRVYDVPNSDIEAIIRLSQ